MKVVHKRGIARRVPSPVRRATPAELLDWAVPRGGPLVRTTERGPLLRCPACERERPLLGFIALQVAEKYASQVIAPLKCPEKDCLHVFALHPSPPKEATGD